MGQGWLTRRVVGWIIALLLVLTAAVSCWPRNRAAPVDAAGVAGSALGDAADGAGGPDADASGQAQAAPDTTNAEAQQGATGEVAATEAGAPDGAGGAPETEIEAADVATVSATSDNEASTSADAAGTTGGSAAVDEAGAPATATADAPTDEVNDSAVAGAEAPDSAPNADSTKPDPDAATVDTARFEPDGATVIAGRALPGALVEFLMGDTVLGSAQADEAGGYVAFLDIPPSDTMREVVIRQSGTDATASLVVPPAEPTLLASAAEAQASATGLDAAGAGAGDGASGGSGTASGDGADDAPDDAAGIATADATADGADASATPVMTIDADSSDATAEASAASAAALPATTAPDNETATETADATTAPALADPASPAVTDPALPAAGQPPVLLSDADGVTVVQPALAAGAEADVATSVALDIIGYGPAGELELAGRATEGGTVRVYIDNALTGETPVPGPGGWALTLPAVTPGQYTLRVDEVGADGAVLSRIETPFVHAALPDGQTGPGVRVVQPGNTLWAIARDRYGEPLKYVQVFEANRDRIRNPDLIYPGQVFVLPEL